MNDTQRDIPIGTLTLRVIPGYGEQVVLTDAHGVEIGTEVVGQDLDGYAVGVLEAVLRLVRNSLPDVPEPSASPEGPPYRRVHIDPTALKSGMHIEIGTTGHALGEVAIANPGTQFGLVTGLFIDGYAYSYLPGHKIWVRVTD